MPPSLRKACYACAAAKRRCIPELPQCSRCAERELECTYDLEPVTNNESQPSVRPAHNVRTVFQCAWKPLPLIIFDSVASAHQAAVEAYTGLRFENLPVMASDETLAIVVECFLKPIPMLTFQHRSTPYVHSMILSAGVCIHPRPARLGAEPEALLNAKFIKRAQHKLISMDFQSLSFVEFLAAFHTLVALILTLALRTTPQSHKPALPAGLQDLWPKWRQHLSATLPRELDSGLSAWQAWYTAETARRSLLCIILVDGILEVMEKGYCSYRPLVESLPFDPRTGLWEADSEEEWLAAVACHGGVESSLVSWSEFIESGGQAPRKEYDGTLQRMLLVIHHGKTAADLQDESIKQSSIPNP